MTRFKNMGFKSKMLSIHFALLLPMAILGLLLIAQARKQTLESNAELHLKQAHDSLLFFNLALHNAETTAKTFAASDLFSGSRTNREITETLNKWKERYGYSSISYFNAGGVCVASSDERRRGEKIKIPADISEKVSIRISEAGSQKAEIIFVSPVKSGRRTAGIVEVRARIHNLLALRETIDAPNIRSTILGRGGETIYTNCPLLNNIGVDEAVRLPSVSAAMEGREGYLFERHEGVEFLSVYAQSSGVGDWPGYGWKLILSLDKAELLQPSRTRATILIVAFLMVTGLLILGTFYLSRLITRPLRKLMETVNDMAGGNMSRRAKIDGSNEICSFAAAFNKMADKLGAMIEAKDRLSVEIKEANEHLAAESQQLEMTNKDLKAKQENLKREIAKRLKAETEITRRLEFERIISVISARIAVSDDIIRAISRGLSSMGRFIGAGRAYVFISDTQESRLSKFCLWKEDDVRELTEQELGDFSSASFVKCLKKLKKGSLIKNSSSCKNSDCCISEELRVGTEDSNKGILLLPMKIRDRSPAFFALDNFSQERPLQKNDISLLDIFANILSKAVEHYFLKEERKKYEFMVNATLTMQTLINRDYVYEAANHAFCDGLRLEHKQILGREVSALWGKTAFNNVIKPHLDRCFAGEIVNYQDSFILPNQSKTGVFDITMYPYPGGAKEPSHAVVITRDMSSISSMKEQMAAQSKLAGIGKLAAGVAHELNNPLTAVMTYPDLIAASAGERLKADEREELMGIKYAGERMKKIVQDLLTFSRPSEKKKKKENVNEIIKAAVALSNPALKSVTLKTALEPVPDFQINREKMTSVFLNLISNSVDAMEKSPQKKIIIRSEFIKDSGKIVIRLADTGEGMGSEVLEKIFDPFFTLKESEKGTGLGLSIVHGVVVEHGGKIEVSSVPLKGTEFTLTFPAGGTDD